MQAGSVDVESCWKAMELDEKAVEFGDYRRTKPEFASVAGGTRTVRKGPSFASATSGKNPKSDDGGALMSFLPWGRHSWRYTRGRGTSGRIFWWSGASSYTLMATDLDGVARCRFEVC